MKGLRDYWSIGPAERVKFNMCVAGHTNVIETIVTHERALDEDLSFVEAYYGSRLFAYPGFRDWWKHTDERARMPETISAVNRGIESSRETHGFWDAVAPLEAK